MSKHTYEERLCAGLAALGWTENPNKRGKYRQWKKVGCTPLFVGSAGALRAGRCATKSYSIGQPSTPTALYAKVLAAGDKALGPIMYE